MTEEETTQMQQAPGLILAYAPQEAEETGGRRRRPWRWVPHQGVDG